MLYIITTLEVITCLGCILTEQLKKHTQLHLPTIDLINTWLIINILVVSVIVYIVFNIGLLLLTLSLFFLYASCHFIDKMFTRHPSQSRIEI